MAQPKATSQLQSSLRAVEHLSPISCSLHIVLEKGGKVLHCFSTFIALYCLVTLPSRLSPEHGVIWYLEGAKEGLGRLDDPRWIPSSWKKFRTTS